MLSDCLKCWDTPCSCGWEYKDYKPNNLSVFIAKIVQYRAKQEAIEIIATALDLVATNTNFIEKNNELGN